MLYRECLNQLEEVRGNLKRRSWLRWLGSKHHSSKQEVGKAEGPRRWSIKVHKGKEVKSSFGKELPVNSLELLEYWVRSRRRPERRRKRSWGTGSIPGATVRSSRYVLLVEGCPCSLACVFDWWLWRLMWRVELGERWPSTGRSSSWWRQESWRSWDPNQGHVGGRGKFIETAVALKSGCTRDSYGLQLYALPGSALWSF